VGADPGPYQESIVATRACAITAAYGSCGAV
jgi:hypothetical protein